MLIVRNLPRIPAHFRHSIQSYAAAGLVGILALLQIQTPIRILASLGVVVLVDVGEAPGIYAQLELGRPWWRRVLLDVRGALDAYAELELGKGLVRWPGALWGRRPTAPRLRRHTLGTRLDPASQQQIPAELPDVIFRSCAGFMTHQRTVPRMTHLGRLSNRLEANSSNNVAEWQIVQRGCRTCCAPILRRRTCEVAIWKDFPAYFGASTGRWKAEKLYLPLFPKPGNGNMSLKKNSDPGESILVLCRCW